MTGIMFVIVVPTEEHEQTLTSKNRKATTPIPSASSSKIISAAMLSESGFNPISQDEEVRTMETTLRTIMDELNVENASWCRSFNDQFWQVTFPLESRDRCESILKILQANRIGKRLHSVVSVIPCIYQRENSDEDDDDDEEEYPGHPEEKHNHARNSGWNRFLSSVRARLTVAQVVENIRANATLTFDFICLVTIATITCAIGLAEGSSTYLISSMLISPMMGPVLAGTFGKVIGDRKLLKMGVQNELIGLGIATFVGFVYGTLVCFLTEDYGEREWPTFEMISWGEIRTLWVGCLIALLSGAAVALGVLSDNVASLVGVAISTSLMPPAVNAGLLWSIASAYHFKGNTTVNYVSEKRVVHYYENQSAELTMLGSVSMCLTFANIIFIYVAGILVFMIKEVAPIASRDKERRRFWKHDIKIARDYNRTLQNEEAKKVMFSGDDVNKYRLGNPEHISFDLHHSTNFDGENLQNNRATFTWSPCMYESRHPKIKEMRELQQKLGKDQAGPSKMLNFQFPSVTTHTRRLSQIFAPRMSLIKEPSNLGHETKTESTPLLLDENNKHAKRKSKKFIVTRCETDSLNE